MSRKLVLLTALIIVLVGTLGLAFKVQRVEASGTIYIRPDGRVDPPTVPIERDDNVYTFTSNIRDEIVVQRSNIIINGNGYMLQGYEKGWGFNLTNVRNVTIKRTSVKDFSWGIRIYVASCVEIFGNTITDNYLGIGAYHLSSSNIHGNNVTGNNAQGIFLAYSSNNTIHGNHIKNNEKTEPVDFEFAIYLKFSSNNSIYGNYIANNDGNGISLSSSHNNIVNGNDISNNWRADLYSSSNNTIMNNNLIGNRLELTGDSFDNIIANNNLTESGISLGGWGSVCYNIVQGNRVCYGDGIVLTSSASSNIVYENDVENSVYGISLIYYSSNNSISRNELKSNGYGIRLYESSTNNIIQENNISHSAEYGFHIERFSSLNKIYHNNFINNMRHAYSEENNVWDDGYPSGGNYWDDYEGEDKYCGLNQDQLGRDGIGDTAYSIEEYNWDRYPLMTLWTPSPANQPPTCSIKLQKDGVEIDEIDVWDFFDIYVGSSTDDTSIKQVRFSSDDIHDGTPTGEWTEWYDWDTSSGDWDASTKIKHWAFAIGGDKEVWAEVKDDIGQTDQEYANIFFHPGYAIIVAGKGRWWAWKEDRVICHCANNAYRTLRNLGFNDDHIYYLNSHGTQDVDGDGDDEVDAPALVTHFKNSLNEIKARTNGNPILLVIYLVGHGDEAGFLFDPSCDCIGGESGCECHLSATGQLKDMLDEFSSETRMLVFINSCYSGYFIMSSSGSISGPNRIIVTSTHDCQERHAFVWVRSSDRFWVGLNKGLNVKEAFTYRPTPGDNSHMWLDDNGDKTGNPPNDLQDDGELAATTKIGMPGTENLALTPWQLIWKRSPGKLRVYDSQDRVTGLVNGTIKEEIPDSIYDEENGIVAVFSSYDTYRYEIAGTEIGTYGLDIASIEDGDAIAFTAIDIPTSANAIHQYTIDWDALSAGKEGVTIQVDSDGDGVFEHTFTSDSELARDEFILQGWGATRFAFDAVWEDVNYPVAVLSNSSVTQFVFSQSLAQISFKVSGGSDTIGYCDVVVPKALIKGIPWTVRIDGADWNFSAFQNATHIFIYLTYAHASTRQIAIQGTWVVPEFPSSLILPLFMIATLLSVIFYRKKKERIHKSFRDS